MPTLQEQLTPLSPQDALIAVMVGLSAADAEMKTSELVTIERIVNHLPVFARYDADRIRSVSQIVYDLFAEEDGLAALFGLVRQALPVKLRETAYAMACDLAAADGVLKRRELRYLQELRLELDIDRLSAAAIERGTRARYAQL